MQGYLPTHSDCGGLLDARASLRLHSVLLELNDNAHVRDKVKRGARRDPNPAKRQLDVFKIPSVFLLPREVQNSLEHIRRIDPGSAELERW